MGLAGFTPSSCPPKPELGDVSQKDSRDKKFQCIRHVFNALIDLVPCDVQKPADQDGKASGAYH
jgi:hypothetical protein